MEVTQEAVVFQDVQDLAEFISQADGFVYAVAGAPHYISAALAGAEFGIFENHPGRRADGVFGLKAVYHVRNGHLLKVWDNPDPESDQGESLMPVAR